MTASPENTAPAPAALGRTPRDTAYQRIYHRITAGEWGAGTRLPPEAELARLLEVPRPALRQALQRLRLDGIVESRQGAGTRVINPPSRTVLDHVDAGAIAETLACYEYRTGLEGEAAFLAASRATSDDLSAMEAACQAAERGIYDPSVIGMEEDTAFHLALARATDNPHYIQSISAVLPAIRTGVTIAITLPHRAREERLATMAAEHRDILGRISARDAEGARTLMRRHIEDARRRVFLGETRRHAPHASSPDQSET
ncbi:MAG: FadR family transcriptional regulator [Rhodobacteraceae bacterium]|nr:FadR family transcriptional regulator [Paracoccaceae bacterium]MBR9820110.1 FadR family transcriptional regulator [Paracoccaceae bacterium]